MDIWHDSIVAATIIQRLYDIKHPAFHSFRLLNRIWHDAYHEALRTISNYEIACELLRSLLIYTPAACDKKYHFHKKIYKTRSKACAKYGRPELARCPRRIEYAIKYDRREFVYDYIRGQFAEDLKRDNLWSNDLCGIALRYDRADIFDILWDYTSECKDRTVLAVLMHMEDDFVETALRKNAYDILYTYTEGNIKDNVNIAAMDIRDDAVCDPRQREALIDACWDRSTILDFINLVDYNECSIVLYYILEKYNLDGFGSGLEYEDPMTNQAEHNTQILVDMGIMQPEI
jgi:hypothetical protein